MFEIQPAFKQIMQCWHSQIDNNLINDLTIMLNKDDIVSGKKFARHDFDGNFGIPDGEMSYWLLVALVSEICQNDDDHHLIATKLNEDIVFSLLCPEINKPIDNKYLFSYII
ncbi:MAG: hypothetical protein J6562_04280 [Candidatus Schmidhempelia sp.]|nr:hypothetical protein [Candidatus Schmidhempelia sp.]